MPPIQSKADQIKVKQNKGQQNKAMDNKAKDKKQSKAKKSKAKQGHTDGHIYKQKKKEVEKIQYDSTVFPFPTCSSLSIQYLTLPP